MGSLAVLSTQSLWVSWGVWAVFKWVPHFCGYCTARDCPSDGYPVPFTMRSTPPQGLCPCCRLEPVRLQESTWLGYLVEGCWGHGIWGEEGKAAWCLWIAHVSYSQCGSCPGRKPPCGYFLPLFLPPRSPPCSPGFLLGLPQPLLWWFGGLINIFPSGSL